MAMAKGLKSEADLLLTGSIDEYFATLEAYLAEIEKEVEAYEKAQR